MTLRIGLVGAVPCAAMYTGPMLAAGPGTTMEKPLAFTVEGAQRISAAAEAAGRSSPSDTG